jgi:hypothetical protein
MTDMAVYSGIICKKGKARSSHALYLKVVFKVQLIHLLALAAVVLQLKFERRTSVMSFESAELAANAHYYRLVDSTMYP